MSKKKKSPPKPIETPEKTCFDCANVIGEIDENGNQYFKCYRFCDDENENVTTFDGLSEADAKSGCDDCLNWTAKEVVDSTETFPAEIFCATETTESTDPASETESQTAPESGTTDAETPKEATEAASVNVGGYTTEELLEAARRKEAKISEADTECRNLESLQSSLRSQANGYKKPITEFRNVITKYARMTPEEFLRMEEEERNANSLPLIDAAEEAERRANAWKALSVSSLDMPEKDKDKIAACFSTCGEVGEWIAKDWPEKKAGLGGEKIRNRIRDAINKISGSDKIANAEIAVNPCEEEQPVAGLSDGSWEMLQAVNYFDLTDKEWKAVRGYCDRDTNEDVTAYELSSLQHGLSSGEVKFKGLGAAFVEKLENQFLEFWKKFPQKIDAESQTEIINNVLSQVFYDGMQWDKYVKNLDELINDPTGRYDFASDTLDGMHKWATENAHVTPRMIQAANNIYGSASDEYQPMEWEGE